MGRVVNVVIAAALLGLSSLNAFSASKCKYSEAQFTFKQTATGPLKVHVFSPPQHASSVRPAVVIFHGGGWTMGDPSWAFGLVDRFACKGLVTIVPQYRLSDKKTASPADAIEDAKAAIAWTRANREKFELDPSRVAALGWSAGAHLAASAAVFAEHKNQRPDLLALVSPAVSVVDDAHFRSLFTPETTIENFSPAEHIKPLLPPTIIVTGRLDTVTPLTSVRKFHDLMTAAGNLSVLNVYDEVGHLFTPKGEPDNGFPNPDKVVRRQAYDAIDAFLVQQAYVAR